MKNARKIIKGAALIAPLYLVSSTPAQILPLSQNTDDLKSNGGTMTVGGTPAMDLIRLTPGGTGAPLRFGNVIQNSELVFLNGTKLTAGRDYSMDYAVGVVYLCRAFREGDSVSVQYRYDSKAPVSSGSSVAGLPTMKYDLLAGGLSMRLGMGMTERTADGKVLRTNLWGTRNNFAGGKMGLTGSFFAGSRMQESYAGGLNYDTSSKAGQASGETGNSSFLVQQFNYALGGGAKLTADYQSVTKNFSGFAAVKDAGYRDDQIAAFTRERGLKRQGVGLSDLNVGGMKFSASTKSVSDGIKGITASSYAMNNGGLSFSHNSSEIQRGFSRFQDLGVADWQQQQQSQAIRKSQDVATLKSSFGAMSYGTTSINDIEKNLSIHQSKLGFDNTKWGFEYTTQAVDKGFNRFEADRAVFGLEAGVRRQNFSLTKGVIGKDANLLFASNNIEDATGDFHNQNVDFKGKTWSLSSSEVGSTKGFSRFNAMTAPEMDANIKSIAGMYGANANVGAERGLFGQGNGITRGNTTFNVNTGKGSNLKVSDTNIKSSSGKAGLNTIEYATKSLKFNMRKLDLGSSFSDATRLMGFEQQALGTVAGLQRTDMGFNANMGKRGTLDVSMLSAAISGQKLDRTKFAYTGGGIEATYNKRSVDKGFMSAGQMVDPEKDLLASLTGFNETDMRLKLSPLKSMKMEYAKSSAYNMSSTEQKDFDYLNLGWNLDKNTVVGYLKQDQVDKTTNSMLLAASLERLSMSRKFGQSTFSVTHETQQYSGQNATPGSDKTVVAVETQVNKNTSIRTEQTKTSYTDGNKEDINSNTISTKITKNFGVSVTDMNIDRGGDAKDETKRNYGFWYDFGKGVRMNWGYNRQMTGETSGYTNSGFSLGQNPANWVPGQPLAPITGANINGTTLGYSNSTNTWDDQLGRTQAFSSFSLATSKPFVFGPLQACKFNVNSYMASDNSRWLKEDVASQFESHMGKYGLGYQYRSQVDQQGKRAIDRTYQVKTDYTNKAPISAAFTYKQRIMPDNKEYAIRDYQLKWQVGKGFVISNQIQTNPEGPFNANIVLGTTPMAQRRNIWRADFTQGKGGFTFGGQFDEMRDDTLKTIRRTGGMNFSFFQNSGSPLNMFYGIEQNESTAGRNSYVRFGFSFDQKPSANQVFSISVGNQGWLQNTDKTLAGTNDWVARLNYQWRLK